MSNDLFSKQCELSIVFRKHLIEIQKDNTIPIIVEEKDINGDGIKHLVCDEKNSIMNYLTMNIVTGNNHPLPNEPVVQIQFNINLEMNYKKKNEIMKEFITTLENNGNHPFKMISDSMMVRSKVIQPQRKKEIYCVGLKEDK